VTVKAYFPISIEISSSPAYKVSWKDVFRCVFDFSLQQFFQK
jgi:hypothetical protein